MRQQFRMPKGHRLWPQIWVGCPKHGVPEIKAGSDLPGRDSVTRITALTPAGGFALAGRSGSRACLPGAGPAAGQRRPRAGGRPPYEAGPTRSRSHAAAPGISSVALSDRRAPPHPGPRRGCGTAGHLGEKHSGLRRRGFDHQEVHRSPFQWGRPQRPREDAKPSGPASVPNAGDDVCFLGG